MTRFIHTLQRAVALVATALAACLPTWADGSNTLTLADVTAEPTGRATLLVNMDNSAAICALQFDLVLPDGITIATDAYGDPDISIVGRTTPNRHNVVASLQADGAMRIALASIKNQTFTGQTGHILSIALSISPALAPGRYPVRLAKIELTTPDEVPYRTAATECLLTIPGDTPDPDPLLLKGDMNDDGELTIDDVTILVNSILAKQK